LGILAWLDALSRSRRCRRAFFAVAELLLDRLDLFVQIVLALGFFHLALDAATDALFDLQTPISPSIRPSDLLKRAA
jgi:hypothetical protein